MDRQTLIAMLAPVVVPLGLEIDHIDVLKAGQRQLIRVTVDGDGPNGQGPDMDQIAAATKAVSAALDEAITDPRPYVLEVSSRGVEAPLTTTAHYRRNAGRLVSLRLKDGANLTARIVSISDQAVDVVTEDGAALTIALSDVVKAVVQVEFNRSEED